MKKGKLLLVTGIIIAVALVLVSSLQILNPGVRNLKGKKLNALEEERELIERLEKENDDNPESTKYLVTDETISRVRPLTTIEAFYENIEAGVEVYADETLSEKVETGIIKTGMYAVYTQNGRVYELSVAGDIDGDGDATQIDLTHIIRHVKNGESKINSEIERLSADIVANGEIDRADIDWMVEYIVFGRGTIENVKPVEKPLVEVVEGKTREDGSYRTDVRIKIIEQNVKSQTKETIYKISGDMETDYAKLPEDGIITLTQDGIYKITAYTYGIEGNKSKGSSIIIKIDTSVIEKPVITSDPTDWTNKNVTVTVTAPEGYEEENGYEIRYKKALGEEYRKYEGEFEVEENCKIYAIITDGTNNSEEAEYEITNIDKVDPQIVINPEAIKVEENKVTLVIEANDQESGLKEIYVYVNDELKCSYDYGNKDIKEVEEAGELTGLEPGEEYTYYAVVYDKAGNTNKTEEHTIKTLSIGTPIIEAKPTEWTKDNVTVTISLPENLPENEYIIEYKKEGNTDFSIYTEEFTVAENTKITARIRLGEVVGLEVEKIINNIDKVNPSVEIKEKNVTTKSFDIEMAGQDKESGIKKMSLFIREQGEEEYKEIPFEYEAGEDGEYSNNIKQEKCEGKDLKANTIYEYYVEVEDRVGNKTTTVGKQITTEKMPTMEELGVTITHKPTEWTKGNVEVTITSNTQIPEEFTLEYKTEEDEDEEYQEYTAKFERQDNTTIYARLTDGVNYNEPITHEITNIDRVVPVITNVELTKVKTNKFSVTVKAQDLESGLKTIRIYAYDEEEKEYKLEYIYEGNLTEGYSQEEQTKEIEVTGLKQNTKYTYYVEVEDGVGNITKQEDGNEVTTGKIPTLEELGITISHRPTEWTNDDVIVTINYGEIEYEVEYSVQNSSTSIFDVDWEKYKNEFTVEENSIIYARLTDGINAGEISSHVIQNIDKEDPEGSFEKENVKTNGFGFDVIATDEMSGIKDIVITVLNEENEQIDTQTYSYSGNNVGEAKIDTQTASYTLEGLEQNKTYTVKVKVVDQAGNEIDLEDKEITTTGVPKLNATITHRPTDWTKNEVEVTIEKQGQEEFEIEYTYSEEPETSVWEKYEREFEVRKNATVRARLTDGENVGQEITHEINNIDTQAPTPSIEINTIKTDRIKITAKGQDNESGVAKIEIELLDGEKVLDTQTQNFDGNEVGSPKEDIQTKEYEKTNLENNKKYTIKVTVTDKAGNKQSTTTEITTQNFGDVNLNVTHEPTEWTNGTVEVTVNSDKLAEGLKIVYAEVKDEAEKETAEWKEYTNKFDVEENEIVYVRLTDGSNIGIEIEHKIENIDTVKPSIEVTAENVTTRSIEFKLVGQDNESGLKTIKVYTREKNSETEYKEYTYSYTGNEVGNPAEDKHEETYKLDELKQDTTYEYYAKVVDQANNEMATEVKEVTTGSIPTFEELGITITHEPTNWTKNDVTVTINNTENIPAGLTLEYKVGTGIYGEYSNSFAQGTNTTVYARLTDGINYNEEIDHDIKNIDKQDPEANFVKENVKTNGFGFDVTATDELSGIKDIIITVLNDEDEQINTKTYSYPGKQVGQEGTDTQTTSYTLGGLDQNKTYTVKVKVVDQAGNEIDLEDKEITTNSVPNLNANITHNPTDWTNTEVEVTIERISGSGEDQEFEIEYILLENKNADQWTKYDDKFTVSNNTTVYARLTDGKNAGEEISHVINNIDTQEPVSSIEINTTKTDSFKITAKGQDNESGVAKIEIELSNENGVIDTQSQEFDGNEVGEPKEDIQTKVYEKTQLENNKKYTIKVTVTDKAGNEKSTTTEITTQDFGDVNLSVTHEPTEWTNDKVEVTVISDKLAEGLKIVYAEVKEETEKGTAQWKDYTNKFEIEENEIVYVRLTDGSNVGIEIEHKIENIDTVKPIIEVTAENITTRSIDFKLVGQDNESGLKTIKVYTKEKDSEAEYTVYTYPYSGNEVGNPAEDKHEEKYKLDNLKQGTTYEYYVEIVDQANNKKSTEVKEVTTGSIPTFEELGITITHEPTSWTNDDVIVTINNTENVSEEFTLEYKVGTGIYGEYGDSFPQGTNTTVYARLTDGINYNEEIDHEIKNIDKEDPEGSFENENVKTNGFGFDVKATDEMSGIKDIIITVEDANGDKIDTQTYSYSGNKVGEAKTDTQTASYTLDGLDQNKTYTVKVKIVDQAGNEIDLEDKEITTATVPELKATIKHEPTEWTKTEVEVTIEKQGQEEYEIEYTYSEEPETAVWEKYDDKFQVSKNATVRARLTDGENVGEEITHEINNIDTQKPSAEIQVNSTKTNGFKITAKGQDNESGVAKIEIELSDGEKVIDTQTQNFDGNKVGSPKEDIQTKEYEKTNLEKNKQYTIKVTVTDKAGNEQESITNITTLDIGNSNLSVTHEPTDWTNGTVEVTVSSDELAEEIKIVYAEVKTEAEKETAEWKEYTNKFDVEENEIVYVRLTDGRNIGIEIEHKIENIDTVNPSAEVTAEDVTTRSINFKVTAIDNESGIDTIKIYTREKDGDYTYKEYTYSGNEVGDPKEDSQEVTYKLDNLKQGTTYEFYTEVIDKATNRTITTAKEVTTSTIPSMEDLGITISHEPIDWTKEEVQVTINKTTEIPEAFTLQYKAGTGTYGEYSNAFAQGTNTTIFARLTDGVNNNEPITHEIKNIDKTNPKIKDLQKGEVLTDRFSLSFKAQDLESGLKEIRVFVNNKQVEEYTYDGDLTNGYTKEEKEINFEHTGLEDNTEYEYYIEVEDGVGNVTTSETDTVTTGKLPDLDVEITHKPTGWTNDAVTVTITPNTQIPTNYSIEYKVEKANGEVTTNWTKYTSSFEVEENGKVYVHLTDGTNATENKEHIINNIDTTNPSKAEIEEKEIKADRVTFDVTAQDNESGVKQIKVTVTDSEDRTVGTKTISCTGNPVGEPSEDIQTKEAEITGLNQGTEYSYILTVTDAAGNSISTEKQTFTTIQIPTPQVEIKHEPTTWTNDKVTVTITETVAQAGYELQYQIKNKTDWAKYVSSFEMEENGTVYVRYTDGSNNGDSVEHKVENIDTTNPSGNIEVQNLKTNGFTLNLQAQDNQSGLKEVIVTVTDEDNKQVGTQTYTYDGNEVGHEKQDIQTETYPLENLDQNKTYKVNVSIEDQAGNKIDLTEKEVETTEVPKLKATITHTPETWTNKEVTVTINQTEAQEGYAVEYRKEEDQDWKNYANSFKVGQNTTIHARLTEGTNGGEELTHEIQNIDTQNPTGTLEVDESSITMNSFTLNITASDNESGLKEVKVYTRAEGEQAYTETPYTYNGNEVGSPKEDSKNITLKIDEAVASTRYEIYVTVEDQAGNKIQTDTKYATTEEMTPFTGTITHRPEEEWTNDDVIVTITQEGIDETLSIEYRVEDEKGSEVESWTEYTTEFKVAQNGKVYARLTDKKNKSAEVDHNITNIDKEPPVIVSLGEDIEGSNKVITINATDNNGIVAYGITQLETEPSYNPCGETKELQVSIPVYEIGTYYVWVKDVAGNTKYDEITIDEVSRDPVAKIEETGEIFYTLSSAIQKVKEYESNEDHDNMTIIILKNINETNTINDGLVVTINLNGKTIFGTSEDHATITVDNAQLTVIDEKIQTEEDDGISSETTIGRIINENYIAIEVKENSIFTLGEEEPEVSTETPNIIGKENGIKTEGKFNFYDGKIEGKTAINGVVTDSPQLYNASVTTDEVTQIQTAILVIQSDAVAKIEETNSYYTTLPLALEACPDDTFRTITILKTITSTYEITLDNKNIKLDLAGQTVSLNGITNNSELEIVDSSDGKTGLLRNEGTSVSAIITNNETGTLIINGGTIRNTSSGSASIYKNVILNNGELTLKDGILNYTSTYIYGIYNKAGKLNMEGGSISSTTNYTCGIFNQSTEEIEISGGTISVTSSNTKNYAINNQASANITITGGKLLGYSGINDESTGKITINGKGEIIGGYTGIQTTSASNSDIEILAGTISSTSSYGFAINHEGTGNVYILGEDAKINSSGYGVRNNNTGRIKIVEGTITAGNSYYGIYNNGTGTIEILGGTITSNKQCIYNNSTGTIKITEGTINSSGDSGVYNNSTGTIIIGEKEDTVNQESPNIIGKTYGVYNNSDNGIIEFYDGKITGAIDQSIFGTITEIPNNYEIKISKEGTTETATLSNELGAVAQVNDEYFNSLKSAIDYCNENSNVEVQEVKMINNATVSSAFTPIISKETKIILNLNGYIISNYSKNGAISNNGQLEIVDKAGSEGKIIGFAKNTIVNNLEAKLVLSGVTIIQNTESSYIVKNEGELELAGATLSSSKSTVYGINNEGTANITSGTISLSGYSSYGVYNTGMTEIAGGTINISGNKGEAVYNDETGTITMTNGNITLGNSSCDGIYNAGTGTIEIAGGTISSKSNATYGVYNYGGGIIEITEVTITTYSDAVRNNGTGTINISGGTLTSSMSYGVYNNSTGTINMSEGTITAHNEGIYNKSTGTIEITGGIITSSTSYGVYNNSTGTIIIGEIGEPVSKESPDIKGSTYGLYNSKDNGIVKFYDGKITGANSKSIYGNISEIQEGYEIVKITNNDNTETSILSDNIETAKIDETIYYSLQEAIDSVEPYKEEATKIEMLRNVTSTKEEPVGIIKKNQKIQLDLAGFAISGSGVTSVIENSGELEIINTQSEGQIIGSTGSIIENKLEAKLLLSSGTITQNTESSYIVKNAGEVELAGATLSSSKSTVYGINNEGTAIITSGTILLSGYSSYGVYNTGTMEIKGGTITISASRGSAVYNDETGTITMTNGNITLNNSSSDGLYNAGTGTIEMTGGTISSIHTTTYGVYNYGGGRIEITGGTISTYYGIYNTGIGTIDITEVSITANSVGIYNNSTGTINMSGGTITANSDGIYNKSTGTINISGGTITGRSYGANNYGTGTIEITGGIITSSNGYGVYNKSTGTIIIGEIGEPVNKENPDIKGSTYGLYNSNDNGIVKFYDGKITGPNSKSIYGNIREVQEGYEIVKIKNNDNTETSILSNNIETAKIDEEIYYSLQEAIDSVEPYKEEATKIEMLRNVTSTKEEPVGIIKKNQKIQLDLAGFIISGSGGTSVIENNGELEIIDTQSEGQIIGLTGSTIENKLDTKLVLSSGTITQNTESSYIVKNAGEVELAGATLSSSKSNVYGINNEGTAKITSGTISLSGYASYGVYNTGMTEIAGGTINISGTRGSAVYNDETGTITMTNVNITLGENSSYGIYNDGTGRIEMIGGTISSIYTSTYGVYNYGGGRIEITGGTISTYYGIYNAGIGTIDMTEGIITSNGDAISNAGTGTIKITNGEISSNSYGVNNKGKGKIEIAGGTIISNNYGVYNFTGEIKITSGTITGRKCGVYNSGTGTIEITEGTITGSDDYGVYNNSTGTIIIGIDNQRINPDTPTIIGTTYGIYNSNDNGHIYFYDGNVTGNSGQSTYGNISLAENTKISKIQNEDGTETASVVVLGTNIDIAMVNNITFRSLQEAILTCGSSGTITILNTAEIQESVVIMPNTNIVIELNGQTLTIVSDDYSITNEGTLTIKGEGSLINTVGGLINNEGVLTLGDNTDSVSDSPIIVGNTYGITTTGTFNFYDGQVTGQTAVNGNITTWQDGYDVTTESLGDTETTKLVNKATSTSTLDFQNNTYIKKEEAIRIEEDEEE